MRTCSRWVGALAMALVWGGAACSDAVSPEAALVEDGLVLSDVTATTDARIVYVSLRSGTVPGGVTATATNLTSGSSIQAAMIEGGLDPVALPASEGDSIEVEARDEAGEFRRFGGTVSMKYPPVVVRSGPTRGAVDVGLSAIILVVFSEPIDEQTVSPETIELTLDGEPVPVGVRPTSDGLGAEVDPGGLLPSREYTLVVRTGVRDRHGLSLEEEYRSTFSTLDAPVVASVTVIPADSTIHINQPLVLQVIARDQAGNVVRDRSISWAVTAPGVLDVDHVLRIPQPAEVVVTATVEGKAASARIVAMPLRLVQISAGDGYSCGLTATGQAYCWGLNWDGQLGVGDRLKRPAPTLVGDGLTLTTVAAGARFTCGLDPEGLAYCWGRSPLSEFDSRPPTASDWNPHLVDGPEPLTSLSTGRLQACGSHPAGYTACWGFFDERPAIYAYSVFSGPHPFVKHPPLASVVTGDEHTCGIASVGVARCWGKNTVGELGDGTLRGGLFNSDDAFDPYLSVVSGSITFSALTAGGRHTCGLDVNGGAYCWGDNRAGQLGTPPATECLLSDISGPYNCRTRPARVQGDHQFTRISAGGAFTCALAPTGNAYCWGQNDRGQLGNGTRSASATPTAVTGGLVFEIISAGREHACGLATDGLAYCWGAGMHGELGSGDQLDQVKPVRVGYQ